MEKRVWQKHGRKMTEMPTGDLKSPWVVTHHKVATPPKSKSSLSQSWDTLLKIPFLPVHLVFWILSDPQSQQASVQVTMRGSTVLPPTGEGIGGPGPLPQQCCSTRRTRGAKGLSCRAREAAAAAHTEKNTRLSTLGLWSKRKSTDYTSELKRTWKGLTRSPYSMNEESKDISSKSPGSPTLSIHSAPWLMGLSIEVKNTLPEDLQCPSD